MMIALSNITKRYRTNTGINTVLKDITHEFEPGVNTGILGRNAAGKSTLLRVIGGSELPDSGTVTRRSRVSWPLGFAGGFHGSLSGRENLRFVCRIYGMSIAKVTGFVEDFSELGVYMDMPLRTYSTGMRARLAFGLSMALDFDFYLIDEGFSVGDASFKTKAEAFFEERQAQSTLLVVYTIKKYCEKAAVLDNGQLEIFENMDDAFTEYDNICHGKRQ